MRCWRGSRASGRRRHLGHPRGRQQPCLAARGRHDLPVPLVVVGGHTAAQDLPSIGIDNRAIGRLATRHILDGGARRVAIVTGPLDWWEARERLAGWRGALETAAGRRAGRAGRRGRLDALERRGGSPSAPAAGAGHRRRLRQQRPDGAGRAARGPPAGVARPGGAVRGRRGRHRRGLALLAAPHDGPSAPADAGMLAVEIIVRVIRSGSTGAPRGRSRTSRSTCSQPELIVRQSSRPVKTVTILRPAERPPQTPQPAATSSVVAAAVFGSLRTVPGSPRLLRRAYMTMSRVTATMRIRATTTASPLTPTRPRTFSAL